MPQNIEDVVNGALFTVEYNEMVIVRDIDFYSLCEHHLLPFFGKCHIAYIPDGKRHRLEQDAARSSTSSRGVCRCRSG